MHETIEYYLYINLRNFELDTLVYFIFHYKHNIYLMLYIIFLKYIYISKTTTNVNKKINHNFDIFLKNIIFEFREIDAI